MLGLNININKFINKGYQAQQCQLCQISFNLLKLQRIHQCKQCKKFVCNKCGSQKAKFMDQNGVWSGQQHRICLNCKVNDDCVNQTIRKYDLQWCQKSKFSEKWLQKINHKEYGFVHFLILFKKNKQKFQPQRDIIEKDVLLGRTDSIVFNNSFRQFFCKLQQPYQINEVRKSIANVLYAIAVKFESIGYCQGMSAIAAFLLTFSNQNQAFQIFCELLEHIYPPDFFAKGSQGVTLIGLLAEIQFLQQQFIQILKQRKNMFQALQCRYQQADYQRFRTIVQLEATKCFMNGFIGILSFTNTIFIWEQLAQKKSFQVFEKAFLALLYISRDKILQIRSFQQIEAEIQCIQPSQFQDTYFDLQIDLSLKDKCLKDFCKTLSAKWTNSSQYNIKSLSKNTRFTEDQIKFLQINFTPDQQGFVIQKQEFKNLLKIFYEKKKEKYATFQVPQEYAQRIFDMYAITKQNFLDFRGLLCCLSILAKSLLIQQLCVIVNVLDPKSQIISWQKFQALVLLLKKAIKHQLLQRTQNFIKNMQTQFENGSQIETNQLCILLNDHLLAQIEQYFDKPSEGIIQQAISIYKKTKIHEQISKEKAVQINLDIV